MSHEPNEHLSALRCPRCGANADDGVIRYVETIEAWRPVRGVERGVLSIRGAHESGEGYDDGRDGVFECHSERGALGWCGHRWKAEDWVLACVDWT